MYRFITKRLYTTNFDLNRLQDHVNNIQKSFTKDIIDINNSVKYLAERVDDLEKLQTPVANDTLAHAVTPKSTHFAKTECESESESVRQSPPVGC